MSDKKIRMGQSFKSAMAEMAMLDSEILNEAEEEAFAAIEKRMDIVGQNGNDGVVYEKPMNDVPPSRYHVRNIWHNEEWVDFYMFYDQLKLNKPHEIGDSAIEHALKKASQAGMRSGGKTKLQDIEEAIWSLQNAAEMIRKAGEVKL